MAQERLAGGHRFAIDVIIAADKGIVKLACSGVGNQRGALALAIATACRPRCASCALRAAGGEPIIHTATVDLGINADYVATVAVEGA